MSDRQKGYIALFIFLVTLGIGFWQLSIRSANMLSINVANTEANNLTNELRLLSGDLQEIKVDVYESRESAAQQLDVVFPTQEGLTDLTRQFDNFEVRNNFGGNPFLINSINYLAPQESDDGNYRFVPVNIDVTASKSNFKKFLEYIETSGSLESEIRLMTLEDLSLRYPAEFGGTYNLQMLIYAYYSQEI